MPTEPERAVCRQALQGLSGRRGERRFAHCPGATDIIARRRHLVPADKGDSHRFIDTICAAAIGQHNEPERADLALVHRSGGQEICGNGKRFARCACAGSQVITARDTVVIAARCSGAGQRVLRDKSVKTARSKPVTMRCNGSDHEFRDVFPTAARHRGGRAAAGDGRRLWAADSGFFVPLPSTAATR